ncbi:hypothetical protein [Mesorhizobium sp. 128a]
MKSIKAFLFLAPIIGWGLSMMVWNYRKHLLVKKYNGYRSFAHNDGAGHVRVDWENNKITPEFLNEWEEVTRPYKAVAWILSGLLVVDVVFISILGL